MFFLLNFKLKKFRAFPLSFSFSRNLPLLTAVSFFVLSQVSLASLISDVSGDMDDQDISIQVAPPKSMSYSRFAKNIAAMEKLKRDTELQTRLVLFKELLGEFKASRLYAGETIPNVMPYVVRGVGNKRFLSGFIEKKIIENAAGFSNEEYRVFLVRGGRFRSYQVLLSEVSLQGRVSFKGINVPDGVSYALQNTSFETIQRRERRQKNRKSRSRKDRRGTRFL